MLKMTNIKMPLNHNEEDIVEQISNNLGVNKNEILNLKITGKAIDARNKKNILFVYTVNFNLEKNEEKYIEIKNVQKQEPFNYKIPDLSFFKGKKPVVIGSGPAGIFAGLILAKAGLKPIIIERGKAVEERVEDVYSFFESGKLKKESNVQYGEGGAGTFSDGKLTTNTHNIRINVVIEELIRAGADDSIAYLSKPHIGTDELIKIVKNIRDEIESLGGKYLFGTRFHDFSIDEENNLKSIFLEEIDSEGNVLKNYSLETDYIILAIGHSARDTFKILYDKKLDISKKPFSVGVRVEHKQELINKSQYGEYANVLPPAEYKLNVRTSNNRGVYTFCMCPGGVVVPASSEKGYLAINGMSYNKRDLENANSAVLVNVNPEDLDEHILSGIEFQRKLEKKAFELGGSNYKAPVQRVVDFIENKKSEFLGEVTPSYSIGYKLSNINECFPEYISFALRESFKKFENKLKGFSSKDAIITAVESRSSSPIRINRNEEFFTNIKGIIPCGEGAGYAGGIMSAAVDGIRCSEKIIEKIMLKENQNEQKL